MIGDAIRYVCAWMVLMLGYLIVPVKWDDNE